MNHALSVVRGVLIAVAIISLGTLMVVLIASPAGIMNTHGVICLPVK